MTESPARGERLPYRPELDGLRAIAILGVFVAHFALAPLSGGFAGVDVFFVLSGYLITAILTARGPSFQELPRFWSQRFWRIAPAYLVVVALTLAIGAWRLIGWDMHRLAGSAAAAALFAPNAYFNDELGYFSSAAIYTPLLHLWSLGVEAQFYFVWPLALAALRRYAPSRFGLGVLALTILSFAASAALALFDNKTAYFSAPSRLWEFGLGALVAVWAPRLGVGGALRTAHVREALAPLALIALLGSLFFVDADWPWPAPAGLLVALPTAALVATASERGWTRALLASRPMTWLGTRSYALYLVHWPILVLAGYAWFPVAPPWLRWILAVLSLLAAEALHRAVETPWRGHYRDLAGSRAFFQAAAAPAAIAAVAAAVFFASAAAVPNFEPNCRVGAAGACLTGAPGAAPRIALWGDSHAGHLAQGLGDWLGESGRSLETFAGGSCPPLLDVNVAAHVFAARGACRKHNARVFAEIAENPDIDAVALAARWSGYTNGAQFGGDAGARYFLSDDDHPGLNGVTTRTVLRAALLRTVAALQKAGKRVIVVGEGPDLGFDGYRCAVIAAADAPDACSLPRGVIDTNEAASEGILRQAAQQGAVYVDPRAALCHADRCSAVAEGLPLYRDEHHFTPFGSDLVARIIFPEAIGQASALAPP